MADPTVADKPRGHLALPEGEGPWPAVVVVHEALGLNDDIRRQADRLAAAGYLAFAPDLFTGGPRLRCVMRAFRELSAGRGRVLEQIETVRRILAARPDCTGRVGVIGFCMGGGFALLAAARHDFDAAAVNYGAVPRDAERALEGACPIVASYGARDFTLPGKAAELDRTLSVLGVPHDIEEYEGVGHCFLSEYRAGPALTAVRRVVGVHHDPAVAADAWRRILAFFAEYLGGAPAASRADGPAPGDQGTHADPPGPEGLRPPVGGPARTTGGPRTGGTTVSEGTARAGGTAASEGAARTGGTAASEGTAPSGATGRAENATGDGTLSRGRGPVRDEAAAADERPARGATAARDEGAPPDEGTARDEGTV